LGLNYPAQQTSLFNGNSDLTMADFSDQQLRDIFSALREIGTPFSGHINNADLGQEMLDFLAMLDGLKPVFLLGRGVDHADWVKGMLTLANSRGLFVVQGPFWDATPFGGFPDWYADHNHAVMVVLRAYYICKDKDTALLAQAVCDAGGRLSMADEARLLGYPECCVSGHYDRALRYHRATLSVLARLGGSDENRMRDLLSGGAATVPSTEAEVADMEAAFHICPERYGSWNRCEACDRTGAGPSYTLSLRYLGLATRIDPEWAAGDAPSFGQPPR
jgi:hypothetical protein